ncbi:thiol peroxidase [Planctomicrobium sp. SH668]|uniref:thiol peroxidase n=1 Tax=Planctomicrobium sp. SH668 TaxID=3448126 RepID=UPI003F5C52E2
MPQVTLKGNPVTLAGPELKVGAQAPDFTLQSAALEDVTLASSAGKTRVIVTVPSLDTSVCALETKRFNDEAAKLENAVVLVVSTDLPFGQKRWCGSEGVENVQTLSDHRTAEFGKSYGVLIAGGGLDRCLARAVFVVNAAGTVTYSEYVAEIASHPDYDAVLAAARA